MIIKLQLRFQFLTVTPQASQISFSIPAKNPNLNFRRQFLILDCFTPARTQTLSLSLSTSHVPGFDSGIHFREKLLYLEHLNIDSTKVLQLNPNFRSAPLDSVLSVAKYLYSMGIERSDIGRIFDMHPQLLTCDPYSDLYPIFDFLLNDVNIPITDIRKSIIRCPRLLVCSVHDQLKPTLYLLRKLGFVGANAITRQTTLLLVYSVKHSLIPKFEFLQSLGFSFGETVNMVLRSPGLLTCSILNSLQPKAEYFLNEMKGDLVELKRFPQYFSFSLEGKIKPRHRLLVKFGFSLPLSEMLRVNDGEFSDWLIEMRLPSLDDNLSMKNPPGRPQNTRGRIH